jgi:hypothetical protein
MAYVIEPFDPNDVVAHPENYFRRAYIWEAPVRITDWVNALCVTALFLTGLYIGSPILTTSGEPANHFLMGRIREVHFAAGIIFTISFMLRVYWFWAGNNYAGSGFPMVWKPVTTYESPLLNCYRGSTHGNCNNHLERRAALFRNRQIRSPGCFRL